MFQKGMKEIVDFGLSLNKTEFSRFVSITSKDGMANQSEFQSFF